MAIQFPVLASPYARPQTALLKHSRASSRRHAFVQLRADRLKSLAIVFLFVLTSTMVNAQITFTRSGCVTEGGLIVTGDFNRDGKPDLAVATDSAIEICLNQGSGKFSFFSQNAIGLPVGFVTADLNGDSELDLIVSSLTQPTISLFRGLGDGTFVPAGTLNLGRRADYLVVGRFTNDTAPDIITEECGNSSCTVEEYGNDGGGSLHHLRQLMAAFSSGGANMVAGDFNGDGKLDLIIGRATSARVLLGHGDGTFAAPFATAPGGGLTVGSFNRDSKLDLVVARDGPCLDSGVCLFYAAVYLNDGSGHFGLRSRTLMRGGGFLSTDINGDGIQDLVSVHGGHFEGALDYALGHGDGYFSKSVAFAFPDSPTLPVARDLNLDGRHDFAFTEIVPSDTSVLLNNNSAVVCAPPGSGSVHAKICSPAQDAKVSTTFTVKGSGNSPAGVQRLELWVDGKKRAQSANDQIKSSVQVSGGIHRVVVVSVDTYGGIAKREIYVHAQ